MRSSSAIRVGIRRVLVAASTAAFVIASASAGLAAPITVVGDLAGPSTLIDFSQFTGAAQVLNTTGPVQIGTVAGVNVTMSMVGASASLSLLNETRNIGPNGRWDSGRSGFVNVFPTTGPVRIGFNDGPISGFGLFMNYGPDIPAPAVFRAYDASNTLLESFDIRATAPISTPGGINAGAFRGIQLLTANIAYVELLGAPNLYDDLRFTSAVADAAVPEPASLLLFGSGVAALIRRRRA